MAAREGPLDAIRAAGTAGLRVALVGPLPPPAGGMANQTEQLYRLLRTDACEVHVVRSNADYRPAWIGRIRGLRALVRLVPFVIGVWRAVADADVVHLMANSGWSWHLVAVPTIWIAWLRGVPVVVNYRGGDAEAFLRRNAALVRATMSRAAALIVPSGFLQQVFDRFGMRAEIVANVVDLARFAPRARDPDPGPHLVVTRNLEAIYDIGTALRAFARIRNEFPAARLTVAGRGPELGALKALAVNLGIGGVVNFTGSLDPDQIVRLYCSADLMLNPARVDNMPNALLEAMASGVPIVSTNAGGIPFMVENGRTALLVSPTDPEAMARAAVTVLKDERLAGSLRRNGLEAARCYTWSAVCPRLFGVYRGAISGDAKRPCSA